MKERLVAFPIHFSGTSALVGTAIISPVIPLRIYAVSLDCGESAGTVTLSSGESSASKADGTWGTSAIVSGAVNTTTLYSGTTLFGAGTVCMHISSSGTLTVYHGNNAQTNAMVVIYAFTGE